MSAHAAPAPQIQQPASIATASLALGIAGFFIGICSIIGLVLGLVARGKVKRDEISPDRVKAGIIVSAISLALQIIGGVLFIALVVASTPTNTTTSSLSTPSAVSETASSPSPAAPALVTSTATQEPVAEAPAVEPTQESPASASAPAAPAPVAAEVSTSQKNAVRSAKQYLEYSAFSRSGLIGQLEFESYSTEDATYAVDAIDVDWNDQAAKSAKQYLEYSAFSRQGLVDQLVYEGYSPPEAEFGASQAGL